MMTCGNTLLDTGEQCDDGNMVNGDGCSTMCQFDLGCGAGEVQRVVTDTTARPIPDNDQVTGVRVPINFGMSGGVTRLAIYLSNLTHTFDGDLDIRLAAPGGLVRDVSTDNGSSGANYLNTLLIDGAATSITSGTAPMSGRFAPEQSLASTFGVDGRSLNAAGAWTLQVFDDANGDTGTLQGWSAIACISSSAYCGNGMVDLAGEECDDGNTVETDGCSGRCQLADGCGDGNLDPGEQCDDDNLTAGDGCSATCQFENACPSGQTLVTATGTGMLAVPDNTPAGVTSAATVATAGAITRIRVQANFTHPNDADLDFFLVGPNGMQRELSTDNGGTGDNYVSTLFSEQASSSITSGAAPFSGIFRPEQTLSTTVGTDFLGSRAAGTWRLLAVDDTATNTGTLDGWTLFACVDPVAGFCGDSTTNGPEECDDGNSIDTDACTNLCTLVDGCGDGNLDPGEQCDDDNLRSGDGCSSTCQFDIVCRAGEVAAIVSNNSMTAIADSNNGAQSLMSVPNLGLVRQARVLLNISHPSDAQLDLYLRPPYGPYRILSDDNGAGANYTAAVFSDDAGVAVTAGTSPFTGAFVPEQTLAGHHNQTANGSWALRIGDDSTGSTGTLNNWSLAVCVDPTVTTLCGNGIVEPGEVCDDGNMANGDGCTTSCTLELNCGAGETPLVVTSTDVPKLIPDNSTVGSSSTVTVATAGTVRKVVLVIGNITHTFDADLDLTLSSPMGTALDVSSDNGSSGDDYLTAIFDDAAATSVTAAPAVTVRGRYRPEAAFSAYNGQPAAGVWTLKAVDDLVGDVGEVMSWSIGLCVQ